MEGLDETFRYATRSITPTLTLYATSTVGKNDGSVIMKERVGRRFIGQFTADLLARSPRRREPNYGISDSSLLRDESDIMPKTQ